MADQASLPAARAAARANLRVALSLAGVVVGMGALAFASAPLYRLFCQVTGFGGTPQRAERAPAEMGEQVMAVRFDANIGGANLPWDFTPLTREVKIRVGEQQLVFYRAVNRADYPVSASATFNVVPAAAGSYFQKIACFCFSEQRLGPKETLELGVSFFIDPAIAKDPAMRDVDTITLSYTFFRAKGDEASQIKTSAVAPTAGRPVN